MVKHLVGALMFAVVYAAFSFVAADANAFNWPADGRVFLCGMGAIAYIGAVTCPIWR